jgi:voltage-gated potassium channel
MGIMAYTVGMVAQVMVELQLRPLLGRRKLELQLKSIKEHYIICGYGRIGRIIAHELQVNKIPLLVIDSNPDSKQDLERDGIPYIIGDATNEDVFVEAGIERAKGLVSVVTSEADNLFITMTVRGMRPDLFILVRADADANRKKLVRAGASRVVMPYLIGGRKMAHTITRPAVTDFLEFTVHNKDIELKMEELLVGKACYIAVSLTCELKRLYSF